jgi:hypothetical protein
MDPMQRTDRPPPAQRREPPRPAPELYQVVIECDGEEQQRELFERLRREGLRLRLLVL